MGKNARLVKRVESSNLHVHIGGQSPVTAKTLNKLFASKSSAPSMHIAQSCFVCALSELWKKGITKRSCIALSGLCCVWNVGLPVFRLHRGWASILGVWGSRPPEFGLGVVGGRKMGHGGRDGS